MVGFHEYEWLKVTWLFSWIANYFYTPLVSLVVDQIFVDMSKYEYQKLYTPVLMSLRSGCIFGILRRKHNVSEHKIQPQALLQE